MSRRQNELIDFAADLCEGINDCTMEYDNVMCALELLGPLEAAYVVLMMGGIDSDILRLSDKLGDEV